MRIADARIIPLACVAFLACMAGCATKKTDALSGASFSADPVSGGKPSPVSSLAPESERMVLLAGKASGSTAKVAAAISEELRAPLVTIGKTGPANVEAITSCNLVGFGSGIFEGRNDAALIAFAESLPPSPGTKAFIFSTCGAPAGMVKDEAIRESMRQNHLALRTALEAKGFELVGEFSCPGFNDNSFLKLIGGFNKGRPDSGDLERARLFARGISRE
jgi:flavodoxin